MRNDVTLMQVRALAGTRQLNLERLGGEYAWNLDDRYPITLRRFDTIGDCIEHAKAYLSVWGNV